MKELTVIAFNLGQIIANSFTDRNQQKFNENLWKF